MTTEQETDELRRLERAREIALFRYSLIQEVISAHLTAAQRGRRVRELAAMTHSGPGGTEVQVSCQTINRWKRDYLAGGFEALVPAPRQASPRTPGEVLALAAALKRERPERTAAQVQRILPTPARQHLRSRYRHNGGIGVMGQTAPGPERRHRDRRRPRRVPVRQPGPVRRL